MDDVITLISRNYIKDDFGVLQYTESERQIFAKVDSVTRAEFFEGGRNGLNPTFRFTIFAGDYLGETVCRYNGLQYGIYRTYSISGTDYMELYVERKGGTNGKAQ